ncbi:tRNA (adenosine(37)-N6)-threonylcarbamoyltransferase complex dimerization subunit type 1 TsaB [Eubacteriales bacterium OttesenSCG-928-K08]|nr:tRNA (adenosine(37)-N6)-threonylcarbamoyltransferase complex dimerization subunit type 1 TsaB [Eubacteriales bacterium OttesenSCG-928-K08]
MILAFESSSATASVAVLSNGELIAERSLHSTRTHSKTLLPMAQALMEECGFAPNELTALAVNCGPGSFTGVRIGVCIANAMGLALNIPVISINSLLCLNENIAFYPGNVCVMIDARNDSVYTAQYKFGEVVRPPVALTVEQCLKDVPEGTIFVGDGAIQYEAQIRKSAANATIAPAASMFCRAGSLCYIAHRRLQSGEVDGTQQAEPLYLRVSQAERMWEKRNQE